MVYVAAKQAWLRDRVAPVSTKIAPVSNGEKLKVLDHERRFFQVQTPDGKTGWIEEHFVIDEPTYNAFQALGREHAKDPVVATGVLRDELYAHLSPGRDTERYFLLPRGRQTAIAGAGEYPKTHSGGGFPRATTQGC